MDAAAITDVFARWREKYTRPAWTPITETGAGSAVSCFGGSPILGKDEEWPICGTCEEPMRFFLQLELARFPAAFGDRGQGLLQFFYCSADDGDCETWAPFSGTHLVRLCDGNGVVTAHPAGVEPFAVRALTGWEESTDLPSPAEHAQVGVALKYDFKAKRVSVKCEEFGIDLPDLDINLDVAEIISTASAGDKLGGWPHWVQSAEYPACPTCGAQMELLLQVDSEDNIPYMFGDVGCGHITQCPTHREVLAFGWACS